MDELVDVVAEEQEELDDEPEEEKPAEEKPAADDPAEEKPAEDKPAEQKARSRRGEASRKQTSGEEARRRRGNKLVQTFAASLRSKFFSNLLVKVSQISICKDGGTAEDC